MNDESLAVSEEELFAAMTPSRPDLTAFKDAVHTKLARAEEQNAKERPNKWTNPLASGGWIRAAASLLPTGLAPTVFASGAKNVAAKGLASKTLGLAILPLFVVGLAIAGFSNSLTRTVGLRGDRSRLNQDEVGKKELALWVQEHWLASILAVLCLAGLVWLSPLDAAVFLVTGAMVSTAMVARRLSAQGQADRKTLSSHIIATAVMLSLFLNLLGNVTSPGGAQAALLVDLTAWTIFAGAMLAISPFQPNRFVRKKEVLTPSIRRIDAAISIGLALTIAVCWVVLMPIGESLMQMGTEIGQGERSWFDLRLPIVAFLFLALSSILMARAPMPRVRGRRKK